MPLNRPDLDPPPPSPYDDMDLRGIAPEPVGQPLGLPREGESIPRTSLVIPMPVNPNLVEEPKREVHHAPPASLYELMAEAMLDPMLRKALVHEGVVYQSGTLASGNAIRVKVLLRALEAAKVQGWELVRK